MKPMRAVGVNAGPGDMSQFDFQNAKVLAGNVSFGSSTGNTGLDQNIEATKNFGTTPGTPDTEFVVPHNLGRLPIGYIVISLSAASVIYLSTTAATSANIYLKCNVASVAYGIMVI